MAARRLAGRRRPEAVSEGDFALACLLSAIAVAVVLVLIAYALYRAGPMSLWT
jgi:hypothetical protein